MIAMVNICLIVLLVAIIIIFIKHVRKRSRDPPGPLGLPFVGMSPIILGQIIFEKYLPKVPQLKYFKQMREKYGEIWSMETSGQRIVMLASFDVVNEAFLKNGHLFAERPENDAYHVMSGKNGILLSNGNVWKNNRKLSLQALREFQVGKDYAINEANLFIEHLRSVSEHQVNNSTCYFAPFSNIMTQILFNERYDYGDPRFHKISIHFKHALQSKALYTECQIFPTFSTSKLGRILFPDADKLLTSWADNWKLKFETCKKIIENPTEEPSCIFDYFWRNRCQEQPDVPVETKLKDVCHLATDLYLASTETLSSFLGFLCLMLGRYPDVQNDLRNEIQSQVDHYKQIDMNMRKDVPKLLSFIDEVNRFCCLFPSTPRKPAKTFMFRGYRFYPEDAVFGSWGTICRDETLFENPFVFDAYRFMDTSRTRYVASKYLIPLGIGRRSCIGENYINMGIFLILSKMILTFRISLTKETEKNFENILEGKTGFAHSPLFHEIKFRLSPRRISDFNLL